MRAGRGEAHADIRRAVLPKGRKERPRDLLLRVGAAKRRVGKRDALALLRDAAVDLRGLRRERPAERDALQRDLRAEQNQPLVPDVERVLELRVAHDVLQKRVALLQRLVVIRQHTGERGLRLAQRAVDKRAPPRRALLHEQQVLRRKDDRAEFADERGARLFFNAVDHARAPPVFKQELQVLRAPLGEKVHRERGRLGVFPVDETRQLAVLRAAERMPAGEKPDRLEQVRLALRVAAENHVDRVAREDLPVLQVAELLKAKACDVQSLSPPRPARCSARRCTRRNRRRASSCRASCRPRR